MKKSESTYDVVLIQKYKRQKSRDRRKKNDFDHDDYSFRKKKKVINFKEYQYDMLSD